MFAVYMKINPTDEITEVGLYQSMVQARAAAEDFILEHSPRYLAIAKVKLTWGRDHGFWHTVD